MQEIVLTEPFMQHKACVWMSQLQGMGLAGLTASTLIQLGRLGRPSEGLTEVPLM